MSVAAKAYMKPADIQTLPVLQQIFDPDEGLDRLVLQSMQQYGYLMAFPLEIGIWSGQDSPVLVNGHRRLTAAKQIKLRSVPVIIESFRNLESAIRYILKIHTFRRNLSPAIKSFLTQMLMVPKNQKERDRGGYNASKEAMKLITSGEASVPEAYSKRHGLLPDITEDILTLLRTLNPQEEKAREILTAIRNFTLAKLRKESDHGRTGY